MTTHKSKLISLPCLIAYLILVGICYLCGTAPLINEWLFWKLEDHDDYQIRVENTDQGTDDDFLLTVRDNKVVDAECLYFPYRREDGSLYCPFDGGDVPEWMLAGYTLEDMQKYRIDQLYLQAFWQHWKIPICDVKFNHEDHYPTYVGCFFIEGSWIEVSEFTPITCSDSYLSENN